MAHNTKNTLKMARLLIIFFVIIFLFSCMFKYGIDKLRRKENDDIIANMLIIQSRIKIINGNIKVNNSEDGYIGIKVSDIQDEKIKDKIAKIGISENQYEDYYILSKENFEIMQIYDDLKKVDDNEYIVCYKLCDVIYIKGLDIDGKKIYKLSDIQKNDKLPEYILYNQIKI